MQMAKLYLIRLVALGIAGLGLFLLDENANRTNPHTWPEVAFFACMFVALAIILGTFKGGRFNPRKPSVDRPTYAANVPGIGSRRGSEPSGDQRHGSCRESGRANEPQER